MKIMDDGERLMFAANPMGQLFPMFAQGKFSEIELYEYGNERDWSDELPTPPNVGMWVWEYKPTGGGYDAWNGDYDGVDIDNGTWRSLTPREWYFVQQGENPWVPLIDAEEHENRKEKLLDLNADAKSFELSLELIK